MAELHSITGLFYEAFPGISPWGGFFILGKDWKDGIEGMLIDTHGFSQISGLMNSSELKFIKEYEENNGQAFDYKFSLKNGIWMGEYESMSSDYRGKAICKTSLCIKDLTFKKFDLRTPQGYAKALIESMVESGQLEISKDPESGEEIIKPL